MTTYNNNNNKRNNENREIEENNNKKIKFDNNDITTTTQAGVIDNTNLSKQTVKELKLIALRDYNLVIKSNVKKNELIEQIIEVHNKKQEILSKQEYLKNINPFNKEIIEFKIKDGIDPSEWLFWKIFRNKFIYKRIMSNMNKFITPDYDTIISVSNMVKNKQITMLRDKVERNKYLAFKISSETGLNEDLPGIINLFKNDDDQDRLFYHHLFKNYKKYIKLFDSDEGMDKLAVLFILYKCVPALQVIIQEHQYKVKGTVLFLVTCLGLSIFIKYFNITTIDKLKLSKLYSENVHPIDSTIKSIIYLHDQKFLDLHSTDGNMLFGLFKKSITNFNETIRLRTLLSISKLILSHDMFSINLFKGVVDCTFEKIESFSNGLTKKELKLPLLDKLFQKQSNKEFISQLLELFYIFFDELKPESFNLYFGNGTSSEHYQVNEENVRKLFSDKTFPYQFASTKESLMSRISLQFANFKLLEYSTKNKVVSEIEDDLLFSHCLDKDKKIQFIDSIVKNIKSEQSNGTTTHPIISPGTFFCLLVAYDNLELVQYFISELGDNSYSNHMFTTNRFIQSNEMLDYIFHHTDLDLSNNNIFQFKDSQLLKHYESLLKNKYIKDNGNDSNGNDGGVKIRISDLSDSSNEILNYIIESGPLVYDFQHPFIAHQVYDEICLKWDSNEYKKSDFPNKKPMLEIMKLFFYKFQFDSTSPIKFDYSRLKYNYSSSCHSNTNFIKFLDWLYVNHNDRLKTFSYPVDKEKEVGGGGDVTFDPYLLIEIGRQDEIPQSETGVTKVLLGSDTQFKMNIKLLDYILKSSPLPSNDNISRIDYFYKFDENILQVASSKGKLWVFEFIYQNYGSIFNPKQIKGHPPPVYNVKDLKLLVFTSLGNGHLELSEFLFQILPKITQKEFNDYSCPLSLEYFKNKTFK